MIKQLRVGPLDVNCYILYDNESKDGAVIDPGGNAEEIAGIVKEAGLTIKYIINTHGHFDHVGGNGDLKALVDAPLAIGEGDAHMLGDAAGQAAVYGIYVAESPKPDILLTDGEEIALGNIKIKVLHTPGHTEGGLCLYIEDDGILFTGDTLFAGSIGRTDLPGGSYDVLMNSIKTKLIPLPDDVKVYTGHEGSSTMGQEKKTNPYLQELL